MNTHTRLAVDLARVADGRVQVKKNNAGKVVFCGVAGHHKLQAYASAGLVEFKVELDYWLPVSITEKGRKVLAAETARRPVEIKPPEIEEAERRGYNEAMRKIATAVRLGSDVETLLKHYRYPVGGHV